MEEVQKVSQFTPIELTYYLGLNLKSTHPYAQNFEDTDVELWH